MTANSKKKIVFFVILLCVLLAGAVTCTVLYFNKQQEANDTQEKIEKHEKQLEKIESLNRDLEKLTAEVQTTEDNLSALKESLSQEKNIPESVEPGDTLKDMCLIGDNYSFHANDKIVTYYETLLKGSEISKAYDEYLRSVFEYSQQTDAGKKLLKMISAADNVDPPTEEGRKLKQFILANKSDFSPGNDCMFHLMGDSLYFMGTDNIIYEKPKYPTAGNLASSIIYFGGFFPDWTKTEGMFLLAYMLADRSEDLGLSLEDVIATYVTPEMIKVVDDSNNFTRDSEYYHDHNRLYDFYEFFDKSVTTEKAAINKLYLNFVHKVAPDLNPNLDDGVPALWQLMLGYVENHPDASFASEFIFSGPDDDKIATLEAQINDESAKLQKIDADLKALKTEAQGSEYNEDVKKLQKKIDRLNDDKEAISSAAKVFMIAAVVLAAFFVISGIIFPISLKRSKH